MWGTIARLVTKATPVIGTIVTVATIVVEVASVIRKVKKKG